MKADCSKCARKDCWNKDHFEYEMWVAKYGCHRFIPKEKNNDIWNETIPNKKSE